MYLVLSSRRLGPPVDRQHSGSAAQCIPGADGSVIEQKPTNTGYSAPRERESSIAALPDFDHAGQQNGDGSVGILPVTGERLVPGALADRLFREHEARYVF